ncbi:MAG: hypothetical protein LBR72_04890 [Oscillospiraceae bacterium]|jgi:hypothetical protein|nr:hypothetical protein [Oscillospiraceae bacterium]
MLEVWKERCQAQGVRVMEGDRLPGLNEYGFALGRDNAGLYPIGDFERRGEITLFPPKTLNAVEMERMLAAALGLARMWDGIGFLTLRFVKQTDGSDFALLSVEEEKTREADVLLELRGLTDWGNAFAAEGNTPPFLQELTRSGALVNGVLTAGTTLPEVLSQLPEEVLPPEWANG